MKQYRLLDLFCGAGGAAKGYQQAGFYVVGVDNKSQPHYCGDEFYLADALSFPLEGYDAYHASPPCQAYSRLRHLPWLRGRVYPKLIEAVREMLQATGKPYVIENVSDAPIWGAELCGMALGLEISRHRRFECNPMILFPPCPGHKTIQAGRATLGKRYAHSSGVTGVPREIDRNSVTGHFAGAALARQAMGIDWMNRKELAQAIPPAYTEYIGKYLMRILTNETI